VPTAGGHNVIVGVFDELQRCRPGSKLFGFLNGPKGVLQNKHMELTKEIIVSLAPRWYTVPLGVSPYPQG
jgi:6-phosphofructokinase